MQKVHERVEGIARQVFQEPSLSLLDTTTAGDVERWDSLSHIQFIVEIEKGFGVKFKNAEIARLRSIGDLKKLLVKHKPDLAA